MKLLTMFENYRDFTLSKINTKKYNHLKLLIFWPIYGILFMFVEHGYNPPVEYYPVYSPVDDMIPFNEWFFIPYIFWFVFLTGMVLYTVLFEIKEFRRMMHFIMITYTFTIAVYFLFPTCQNLRPDLDAFERDNILVTWTKAFHNFDTNTNVCPSIHVIGSLAVVFAACHTKRFSGLLWKIAFWTVGILICASTVFLKQHSILDVVAAIVVCIVGYILSYTIGLTKKDNEVSE